MNWGGQGDAGSGPPAAGPGPAGALTLPPVILARLMPMYLQVDAAGRAVGAGPTLEKICGGLRGVGVFDLFRVGRPRKMTRMSQLRAAGGQRLHLTLQRPPFTQMRGICLPVGDGALMNLSFGLTVAEAVRDHGLTDSDFAATDLAVEMLYLIEAKSAVMRELQALTRRLDRARQSAVAEAATDPLTGLCNRRGFDMALEAALRRGSRFALAHLDLDHFKRVNDTLGHAAGDAVLTAVARILREATRARDVVARLGGDEFVLLLEDAAEPGPARALGQRILSRIAEPMDWQGHSLRVDGSLGIVLSTELPGDARRLIEAADRALYTSKRQGRGRVTLFRPGGEASGAAGG